MVNKEFYAQITLLTDELRGLMAETKKIAAGILGDSMLKVDFCFCSLLDRCIRLSEGFISLVQARNITCAGAMLRLQMDNCMRLYAIYISNDEEEFADCMIGGGKISLLKDKAGKKMTDSYLKNELMKFDSRFSTVYNNASGYIHYSAKAFYPTVQFPEENCIAFQVGGELPEKINEPLLECTRAFIYYVILFHKLMHAAVDAKARLDIKLREHSESAS